MKEMFKTMSIFMLAFVLEFFFYLWYNILFICSVAHSTTSSSAVSIIMEHASYKSPSSSFCGSPVQDCPYYLMPQRYPMMTCVQPPFNFRITSYCFRTRGVKDQTRPLASS
jgi:hypothetical protein